MASTVDAADEHTVINFADQNSRRRRTSLLGWDGSYGIWSCKFSADGNEIVAGGRSHIFGMYKHLEKGGCSLIIPSAIVYDLLANRRTVMIPAHDDDINSCCWADTGGNILVSASDDSFIKVWWVC